MTNRQIFQGRGKAEREAEGLLQTILLAELLAPSEVIWLISPWVTDVSILDNRTGAYAGVQPTWPRRAISLVEVLGALLREGVGVVLATRPDPHNQRFVQRLESAAKSRGCAEKLLVHQDERERLHEKGLLGDDFYVSGSMNFTESGIRLNDEAVKLELDRQAVAQARVHFRQNYGAP
jgi:phosphatidylserine/phosphatidylglycerophosphate/cardiolipin synthase-like enzyme